MTRDVPRKVNVQHHVKFNLNATSASIFNMKLLIYHFPLVLVLALIQVTASMSRFTDVDFLAEAIYHDHRTSWLEGRASQCDIFLYFNADVELTHVLDETRERLDTFICRTCLCACHAFESMHIPRQNSDYEVSPRHQTHGKTRRASVSRLGVNHTGMCEAHARI